MCAKATLSHLPQMITFHKTPGGLSMIDEWERAPIVLFKSRPTNQINPL